jgi:alginate O-acetyltransferase complex protein AlgI
MLFQTPEFLILVLLSWPIYWLVPQLRLFLLGISGAVFYGWAGTGYLILFFLAAAVTYFCSRMLHRTSRKIFLRLGIAVNIANLFFFKYFSFLLHEWGALTGWPVLPPESVLGDIVLPIGISFYTFQLMAYLVDVYRGEITPPAFTRFWVFISFFAQLVAGPIMRGKDFLPQIQKMAELKPDINTVKSGLFLIVLGLVKKVVIADNISYYVDFYFYRTGWLTGIEAWIGAYLFGFQIYLDFSGYSDIALGLGRLFGLKLSWNFRTPYLSTNPSEFWRRWHITLSNWVRDYIYIPLGGSRKGAKRRIINLLLAMTICGIWHGASWTFMLWGIFHGAVLGIYHWGKKRYQINFLKGTTLRLASIFLTCQIVSIGWVFFRSPTIGKALIYISEMFMRFRLIDLWANKKSILILLLLFAFHWGEDLLHRNPLGYRMMWVQKVPGPLRGLAYFIIFILMIILYPGEQQQFIYFRF